ncbi:Rpn family recombination-promoting nuclease/putative transposase [Limnofasciculus baicalensis]|uniref:Rpn family recombination-promoting nuclease/putative transposase n=1 Tax=Limnofasciculus baicalensis BBK-W-15 TaxID=2699891 RepID=A0AAE3GX53_9CYAN|nr:Rpn family recombination-promoting nuclease/putative transposase [Limnofasciculus baicalensis]MCP2732235.1 Rpn family recombination-promoting nuclease/putative transposase [Limnofasciculus baicalensis BBK-W-15]
MRFISPKTDFAFKKIFGSTDSKDILISFLNAILYPEESAIEDLEIIDPYSPGNIAILKDSFLDVKARIKGNTIVIIEMQVLNVMAFDKRVVYNAAKAFTTQLKSGQGYSKLNPVIALTITDFTMFPKFDDVISRFSFVDMEHSFAYPDKTIDLVFVELPKFTKELEEIESLTDKWLYFMKQANSLETIPEKMGEVSAIQKAFTIANVINLTLEEFEDLDKRQMFIEDQQGAILKGREEGREEGRQEGQAQLIIRVLERRWGEIAPDMKTRILQLSSNQLENLGEAVLDFSNLEDLIGWLVGGGEL